MAICDLPGPLKPPLAAMLVPKTPTDRTSTSGRGDGVGEGVAGADAAALEGSGLAEGSGVEQAVRTATDKASNLMAARR